MAPPDVSLFPHATGKAAELVAQHESPQEIAFWSGWFCPFNQRVWIALKERGIPYQYKEIKGPYFSGEEFSLVDVAIAPYIARERIITEHREFKSSKDKEKYQPIYGRYLRDEAQSEAAKATRAGRPLP
ncbi:hypothetical protein BJ138DRAFT_1102176 [Hygrophoropsis aurantiaca]|uniref:Uncharacterized protein n=1 Tax=Hygrophoropsis aurantiaca TaxID=72124 RepID=A0ACB8AAD4_9AGAM|nr:hypothetical protein BJ138DRAFT_1102176 [Hygrophoropsis aurantiaca]